MHNPVQRFEQRFSQPQPAQYLPRRVQAIQALAQWKMAGQDMPDLWLRLEIGGAFQQLVALAFPGTPAVEMLPVAAELWISTLGEMNLIEEIDRPRIRKGFSVLYTKLRQWPQVADLLEALPPRPQRVKLEAPPQSEADREAGKKRMQDILDSLGADREE